MELVYLLAEARDRAIPLVLQRRDLGQQVVALAAEGDDAGRRFVALGLELRQPRLQAVALGFDARRLRPGGVPLRLDRGEARRQLLVRRHRRLQLRDARDGAVPLFRHLRQARGELVALPPGLRCGLLRRSDDGARRTGRRRRRQPRLARLRGGPQPGDLRPQLAQLRLGRAALHRLCGAGRRAAAPRAPPRVRQRQVDDEVAPHLELRGRDRAGIGRPVERRPPAVLRRAGVAPTGSATSRRRRGPAVTVSTGLATRRPPSPFQRPATSRRPSPHSKRSSSKATSRLGGHQPGSFSAVLAGLGRALAPARAAAHQRLVVLRARRAGGLGRRRAGRRLGRGRGAARRVRANRPPPPGSAATEDGAGAPGPAGAARVAGSASPRASTAETWRRGSRPSTVNASRTRLKVSTAPTPISTAPPKASQAPVAGSRPEPRAADRRSPRRPRRARRAPWPGSQRRSTTADLRGQQADRGRHRGHGERGQHEVPDLEGVPGRQIDCPSTRSGTGSPAGAAPPASRATAPLSSLRVINLLGLCLRAVHITARRRRRRAAAAQATGARPGGGPRPGRSGDPRRSRSRSATGPSARRRPRRRRDARSRTRPP